jgi:ABC-2 type transport system ATP-binding protein
MFRRLHFLSDIKSVDRIIEKLQLGPYADRKARNLSLGNNQRLGLAKALIHQPEILILDEPTNGLDPAGIFETRELLSEMAINNGVTIFISSHILGEISRFATRIGIIHNGKLIQEFKADQLKMLSNKRLIVSSKDNTKAAEVLNGNGYVTEKNSNNQLELRDAIAISSPDVIATLLVGNDCPPVLLKIEEEDLESYFLRIIGIKDTQ